MSFFFKKSGTEALRRMTNDPDMQQEALPSGHPPISALAAKIESGAVCPMAKLNIVRQSHVGTDATARMVSEIGLPTLRRFTTNFYKKAFQDPHLDQFIRSHQDPHGERFASWIAEKLGAGTPWTQERRTRNIDVFTSKGHEFQTPHDRSSSHFAAWHSPKRSDDEWGEHFKLDDCRVWMRLHFWAAREEGLLENASFADYYVRFIAHFISVYERTAPPFARDSMRWSAEPANVQRYLEAGRALTWQIRTYSMNIALSHLHAEASTCGAAQIHHVMITCSLGDPFAGVCHPQVGCLRSWAWAIRRHLRRCRPMSASTRALPMGNTGRTSSGEAFGSRSATDGYQSRGVDRQSTVAAPMRQGPYVAMRS